MRKWDFDLVEKEIKDGVEMGVRVGGEELRVHVEDATQGRASEAKRREAVLDGEEGGEWSGTEIWVELESFAGIDVEVFEVEDFLAEEEAGV